LCRAARNSPTISSHRRWGIFVCSFFKWGILGGPLCGKKIKF
jgi:hypothetical protein